MDCVMSISRTILLEVATIRLDFLLDRGLCEGAYFIWRDIPFITFFNIDIFDLSSAINSFRS